MMIRNLSRYSLLATIAVAIFAATSPAMAAVVHRWSFSETGGAGTTLVDSVGAANATITDVGVNNGDVGTSNAGQVTLAGGLKGDSDYVTLPNNILNVHTDATIELWATNVTVQNWSRLFSFGSSTTNNLFMSWTQGTNINTDRAGFKIGGTENRVDNAQSPYTLNTEFHVAMVIDDDGGAGGITQVSVYRDGVFQGSFDTTYDLNQLVETENTLGRAKYGDNVANALYNELRIFDGALSAASILQNFTDGPDEATGDISIGVVAPPPPAANVDFDNGGVGNDWNTALNWDNDAVPTAPDNVWIGQFVNAGSQTIAITADPLNEINELGLGRNEPGATMTINHSAGDLVTNSWTNLGQNAGDHGVYNLSGGTVTKNGLGNTHNVIGGFGTAIGELHISGTGVWTVNAGDTRIGGETSAQTATTGIVTISNNGQFVNNGLVQVGVGGNGSITVSDAGTLTAGVLRVGEAGTGTFTHNSSGTSTVNELRVGSNGQGMGTATVSAGILNVGNVDLNVGRDNTTNLPILEIKGTGTLNHTRNTVLGFNGQGVIDVSENGTFNTNWLIVGEVGSSTDADLKVSGNGTLSTTRMTLGLNGSANGLIEITGSNATVTTGLLDVITSGSNTMSWIADASGVSAIDVNGAVDLDPNPLLSVDLSGYTGGAGVLTLIDNDAADAVLGMFAGLAEGAAVLGTGYGGSVNITYINGGNDVALVLGAVIPAPAALPAGLALIGLAAMRRRRH